MFKPVYKIVLCEDLNQLCFLRLLPSTGQESSCSNICSTDVFIEMSSESVPVHWQNLMTNERAMMQTFDELQSRFYTSIVMFFGHLIRVRRDTYFLAHMLCWVWSTADKSEVSEETGYMSGATSILKILLAQRWPPELQLSLAVEFFQKENKTVSEVNPFWQMRFPKSFRGWWTKCVPYGAVSPKKERVTGRRKRNEAL